VIADAVVTVLMKSKARLSLKDKQDNGTPRVH
jgi:hypothetical protein